MDTEQNKKNAIAFYEMAFFGEPLRAVELYVGEEYIQHNPDVEDGKGGFVKYFNKMHDEYPTKNIRFVRSVAENDIVSLHTHQEWHEDGEYVTMDFFRFDERGKICEHWDVIQKIPEKSVHSNKMY